MKGFISSLHILERHKRLARLFSYPEFYSFLCSVLAFVMLLIEYMHLASRSAAFGNRFWAIIGYHLSGGAALGVMKAAVYDEVAIVDNILINGLVTLCLITAFNTLFSLSCKKVFRLKLLEHTLSGLTNNAQSQKKTWVRFGIPGIFIFVFFPMTGTGPIIGSVLGKLLGISFWANISTVFSGSLTSIILFAFASDKLSDLIGGKTLNLIVYTIIVIIISIAVYSKWHAWKKDSDDKKKQE